VRAHELLVESRALQEEKAHLAAVLPRHEADLERTILQESSHR